MLKFIRNICGIASFVVVIGAAGSSDLNRITNAEAIKMIVFSIILAFIAWVCHRVIVIRRIARRRRLRKATANPANRRIG